MTNEEFIRDAYHVAEIKDIPGWVACFTPDGTFTDESLGVTYRGPMNSVDPLRFMRRRFPICIGNSMKLSFTAMSLSSSFR